LQSPLSSSLPYVFDVGGAPRVSFFPSRRRPLSLYNEREVESFLALSRRGFPPSSPLFPLFPPTSRTVVLPSLMGSEGRLDGLLPSGTAKLARPG